MLVDFFGIGKLNGNFGEEIWIPSAHQFSGVQNGPTGDQVRVFFFVKHL